MSSVLITVLCGLVGIVVGYGLAWLQEESRRLRQEDSRRLREDEARRWTYALCVCRHERCYHHALTGDCSGLDPVSRRQCACKGFYALTLLGGAR